ncbi:mitochondrial protein Fmp26, putative [Talaromyces stipitatus ATCC 10500]|uniref:Altered inheritance of mitochondria protein 24, mitochondrial n=1 Tax=Talaromyces stipitatus (strain ATCC 10500 / CBS 375.48 / QM 6759 / NRRL 1006) TaxID=441959 RepID=AIM24_TALSN|nr:mitochondrial protein Fmp26, putative [Talaromyces stipitatus ATCC 10500]B8MDC1.1 RecName: Full=Altered inheritance of mitochondria protein 24, mitochondrial; Flags: Precursor [Talaromyces stipitatus ATCC 10500]EED17646.1 mitochondrial protein Fmp26, putative [Talaromyces stipitatus ATCC 10500]
MRLTLGKGATAVYRARAGVSVSSPLYRRHGVRNVQIKAAPLGEPTIVNGVNLPISSTPSSASSADAKFHVVGTPYSMLSVSLSASQNLYTQRGTLVGLSGKADNVISTLSVLEPSRRAIVGIPFLYQKISSPSPIKALVSVRSPVTSFAVVHLDGTVDWMVAQRRALLAWTGHSLKIKPRINTNLSVTNWGSSEVTGRGLLALVGRGQVYSVELKAGEQYIAHPSNIVAYTLSSTRPQPYRFKSTTLRFQIPGLQIPELLLKSRYVRDLTASDTWKASMKLIHNFRTWARRTIWGDRLFLQFNGPATLLIQSRGARVRDIMSDKEVNEIADTPTGATLDAINKLEARTSPSTNENDKIDYQRAAEEAVSQAPGPSRTVEGLTQEIKGVSQTIATIRDGKVEFEKLKQQNAEIARK